MNILPASDAMTIWVFRRNDETVKVTVHLHLDGGIVKWEKRYANFDSMADALVFAMSEVTERFGVELDPAESEF